MAADTINLAALSKAELQALVARWEWPRYRVAQIWQWLYRQRVTSVDEMTNLSAELREQLARRTVIHWPRVVRRQIAADQTRKLLIELEDGRRIESVLIPDDGREFRYEVVANYDVDPSDPESLKVMAPTPTDTITLITCGGTWIPDRSERFGGEYTNRTIVQAELVDSSLAVPSQISGG